MSKLLDQIEAAVGIARDAFAAGDKVTGIAAIQLAAQLIQIARLLKTDESKPESANNSSKVENVQ